jgi:hypothetical protein
MFGIKHKLNDSSLYLLHDMVEGLLQHTEGLLAKCTADQVDQINQLKTQIASYKRELLEFENDVANQRAEMFQFSVEELYFMYGQYEGRFIGIEFHKLSDAGKKYPRNIGGVIYYTKSEREDLEKIINSGNNPRTNGLVKINVSSNYNLTKEQTDELLTKGILSGDIYQIQDSIIPAQKAFKQEGIKEIPNTININFDPTGMDPHSLFMWIFSQRVEDRGLLIETEWCMLFGYGLYYEPESVNWDFIRQNVFDVEGNKNKKIRFYELSAKLFNADISKDEISEFKALSKERGLKRVEMIREEIMRSTNKTLEKFAEEYPEIYKLIQISAETFEEETLEHHKTFLPIYWDFKSYLHIYLRHCEELQIEGHFENKTKFQYTPKDIKRILKKAIRKLSEKINERLENGKDFRCFGEQSFYFNGNFYAMRIEKDGRVDSFHPLQT